MTTDETFDPPKIGVNPQGRLGDVHGLTLTIGGQNGDPGNGGDVQVTIGGRVNLPSEGTGGAGGAVGSGGAVNIISQAGTAIMTSGDGAYGVLS